MANTIKIKNSGTASAVPSTLEYGELGLNYADGKLFYKNLSNAIVAFGGGATTLDGLSDVVITSPQQFQTISYDGTNWVNDYSSNVTFVRNDEANTITAGTIVYISGSTGDHAKVKRADNGSDSTSATILGVAGANITSAENGPVVTLGYVKGLDLSTGYTAGDIIWLGENGAFTKTKPNAPDHLVFIGVVVRATSNGIIFVAPQNGYELDELHDVNAPTPETGEVLTWNGTVWVDSYPTLRVSDTPPSSPAQGQIWYESDTGKTFVYYDSFWVEAIGSPSVSNIDSLIDVTISSPLTGQVLQWNGSAWVNAAASTNPMNDSKFSAIITMDIGA